MSFSGPGSTRKAAASTPFSRFTSLVLSLFLTGLALLSNAPAAHASEAVTIPDSGFAACIANLLGRPPGTASFQGSDLATITFLNCPARGITNLQGAQYLSHISSLSLVSNHIADLSPLSGLTTLNALDAGNNEITSLSSLRSLTHVNWVKLSDNRITDVSGLTAMQGMRSLNLHGNRVADVSGLAGLTLLVELDLSGNSVADVSPLAGLISLTTLDLSSNQVANLSPLAGLTGLTALNLSTNQVANLSPLAGLTGLPGLNLSSNRIANLSPLAGLTGLTWLDLSSNQVVDLSPLAGLGKLGGLYLSDNAVVDISPLAGLTTLGVLNVERNRLADLSPLVGLTSLIVESRGQSISISVAPAVVAPLRLRTRYGVRPTIGKVPIGLIVRGDTVTAMGPGRYEFGYSGVSTRGTVTVLASGPARTFARAPKPTTTGTAKVGKTLRVKLGKWSPKPGLSYQWRRDGANILRATKSTYKLVKDDRGHNISVAVTGAKLGYWLTTRTSKNRRIT